MASPRYLFCQALLCESLAVSGAQKPIRRTNAGVRRLYNVAYSLAEPNSDSRTLDEPLRKLAESRRMKERSIEKGFAPTLIPIDGARSASRNDSVRPCATPSVTRRDPTSQRVWTSASTCTSRSPTAKSLNGSTTRSRLLPGPSTWRRCGTSSRLGIQIRLIAPEALQKMTPI